MITESIEKELYKVMFWTPVMPSDPAAMPSEEYGRFIIHSFVVTVVLMVNDHSHWSEIIEVQPVSLCTLEFSKYFKTELIVERPSYFWKDIAWITW